MSVTVRAEVAAADFALAETMGTVPGLEVTCADIVAAGTDVVMPMLWIRAEDGDAARAALDADPTVERIELIDALDGARLYRLEWIDRVDLVLHILLHARAILLSATGTGERWTLSLLYPDRETVRETAAFCETHGIDFEVAAVAEMTDAPRGRSTLSEEQYEALVAAREQGYFDIPRQVGLRPLAESLGISHQALSERLRRGTRALVDELLRTGAGAGAGTEAEPPLERERPVDATRQSE